jgi:hypothetical protein
MTTESIASTTTTTGVLRGVLQTVTTDDAIAADLLVLLLNWTDL